MLNLLVPTSSDWVSLAIQNIDLILLDNIHCEKKAASTAMSLISRYPAHQSIVRKMSAMAVEEMEHFCLVYDAAIARGLQLSYDTADEYVNALRAQGRKQEPEKMLDSFLIASLIEARSCERFSLLIEQPLPSDIGQLYRGLIPSEAGHYALFQSLAREYFPESAVKERFDLLRKIESEIVLSIKPSPRMHG